MPELTERYPWLDSASRRLASYLASGRLPQGLLISGATGLGKGALAKDFARRLLCGAPTVGGACGLCPACRLAEAGNHPDYLRVEPEEAGKRITVDAVRKLIDKLSLKPQYSASRVVLIRPAHAMNIAAANSLLKTLEEPDPQTLFILVSEQPSHLPATILSRCQRLEVALPERGAALRWLAEQGLDSHAGALLAMANGAPLRAIELHGSDLAQRRKKIFDDWIAVFQRRADPLTVAEQWAKEDGDAVTGWLQSWIMDLIRIGGSRIPVQGRLVNADLESGLRCLADAQDLRSLFRRLDEVEAGRRSLEGQANRQLIMEDILINWSHPGWPRVQP